MNTTSRNEMSPRNPEFSQLYNIFLKKFKLFILAIMLSTCTSQSANFAQTIESGTPKEVYSDVTIDYKCNFVDGVSISTILLILNDKIFWSDMGDCYNTADVDIDKDGVDDLRIIQQGLSALVNKLQ